MDKNTPSSARAPSPTVRVDDVPGDERRRRAIRWADDNIGRGGALAAAKTYGAAFGAAADAAGYLSGDPGMRARADIRGLLPMHLRCSVRVHHVNFLHPCIEPMTAALGDAAGREGGREGGGRTERGGIPIMWSGSTLVTSNRFGETARRRTVR